LPSKSC